jgi:FkbM family methyltransferase
MRSTSLSAAAAVALAVWCPLAEAQTPLGVRGKKLYSQGNEELIVRDFFHDRRDGFFLDVGCAAPVQYSNTYYLEKHLGWSGIAVDALPEYALAWRRKRPRSKFFNYLVTDHADSVEPFFRSEHKGTSSVERPATGPAGRPVKIEEIQVPTTTLTRLLDQQGVTHVDFLSLDIEGHEPPALEGFDIDRFHPALACVEAKPANRERLLKYFAGHGYERIERYLAHDLTNWYFSPKGALR